MCDEAKRAYEWAQFERFAAACGFVPAGPGEQPSPPEPDIVVGPPGARVAVELTDLHPGVEATGAADEPVPVARARERQQEWVTAAARRAYEGAGHPPVNVWISWIPRAQFRGRDALAKRIATVVAAHPPRGSGLREVGTGFEPIEPGLPVAGLAIAAATGAGAAWRDGDMHQIGVYAADEIQARIATEDAKVGRYREPYASRWLVLVIGAAGPSTWGEVGADVERAQFRSRYDRVFVLEYVPRRVHELQLVPGGPERDLGRAAS